MDTQLMLVVGIIVLVLILVAGGIWAYAKMTKSNRLKAKFGPEYDHTVARLRNRQLAETELQERERRVEGFHIVPLSMQDDIRYRESWTATQGYFVDDPRGAVEKADRLVHEVMKKRGYPVTNFEQVAADLSVEYPAVVTHYRAACRIAENSRKGSAKTEELRQALVHYRALFEELLESKEGAMLEPTPENKDDFRLKKRIRGGLHT
jgi:FtsZ-interacting cell division protein ZipA